MDGGAKGCGCDGCGRGRGCRRDGRGWRYVPNRARVVVVVPGRSNAISFSSAPASASAFAGGRSRFAAASCVFSGMERKDGMAYLRARAVAVSPHRA